MKKEYLPIEIAEAVVGIIIAYAFTESAMKGIEGATFLMCLPIGIIAGIGFYIALRMVNDYTLKRIA